MRTFSTTAGSKLTKTARRMLSCASFREESVERAVSSTDGTVPLGIGPSGTSEARRRLVDKFNGALRSVRDHLGVDILRHHITSVHETARHAVAVAGGEEGGGHTYGHSGRHEGEIEKRHRPVRIEADANDVPLCCALFNPTSGQPPLLHRLENIAEHTTDGTQEGVCRVCIARWPAKPTRGMPWEERTRLSVTTTHCSVSV